MKLRMQVLECAHCKRQALALVSQEDGTAYRLTNHKCAGQWNTLNTLDVELPEDMSEFIVKASGR